MNSYIGKIIILPIQMRKINLLYIITKLELGGAQKQLLSLISHLDKTKFRLFLFTNKEGLLLSEVLPINELTIKKSRHLERSINPVKDWLALIEIYSFIRKNNIEIVHTHSSKAGILGRLAAKLAKTKVIVHTVHGWGFNDYQLKIKRLWFIWLERVTANFTDKLIVVSNYDQQIGLNNYIGAKSKYKLIRYGIDYSKFNSKRGNLRAELGIKINDLVVGMVACLKPQKCPQDFIKLAFLVNKELSGIKFILVGEGILRKKTEKLIVGLNLQKQFILTGWRRDIPGILSAIDIFVLTSLWEGLPIAVLEAMASSKAVISTHTGGVGEVIVNAKSGFLVPRHDMKMMSQRLVFLLKNEALRGQIGKEAKNSLGNVYCVQNMIRDTENLYHSLIETQKFPA